MDTPLEKIKKYIDEIDFSMIIDKMVKHQKWRRSDAEAVCQLYRNFLFLQKKYGDKHSLPPSEEVDEFWHNHILDTKKYRHDCEMIFGRYNDHYPYFGIDDKTNLNDLNNAFEEMQKLHQLEFGYPVERITRIKLSEIAAMLIDLIKMKFRKSDKISMASSKIV